MNSTLHALFARCGQSPWLDNLQRGYLRSGHLSRLRDSGVRGLTSNPTIFQKAIQQSSDYDSQFEELLRAGSSPREAYWTLVMDDIVGAAELFSSLHDDSGGVDGFVSVEVDPNLAHDTEATVTAARRLRDIAVMSNVMIKVPATVAGLPAIRTLIAEAIPVNVTLIFGLDRYQAVMDAYLSGLEDRVDNGLSPAGIQSVASFFISRVDAQLDPMLESAGAPEMMGGCAIDQARLAYRMFLETFSGPRWEALERRGATPQRPLWASTSTKNPAYPDTMYVDRLIGPSTVNTIPDATLDAFLDHGSVARTIDLDVDASRNRWGRLADLGINVDAVAADLEQRGVASFIESFEDLMSSLEAKAAS